MLAFAVSAAVGPDVGVVELEKPDAAVAAPKLILVDNERKPPFYRHP